MIELPEVPDCYEVYRDIHYEYAGANPVISDAQARAAIFYLLSIHGGNSDDGVVIVRVGPTETTYDIDLKD